MTNREFKCWLNGFLRLASEDFLINKQVKTIRNHANLVATLDPLDKDIDFFVTALEQKVVSGNIPLNEVKNMATAIEI